MVVLADTVLPVIARAIAARVELLTDEADEFAQLTVYPYLTPNPSPPAVDIYPAEPSQDEAAFGPRSRQTFWTVRARVATSDLEGQQLILLALMAPSGDTSLMQAILDYGDDGPLDGHADAVNVVGQTPSGYRPYQTLDTGVLLVGVEWTFAVYTPSENDT